MTKDELCEYAQETFGVELNKRHTLNALQAEVEELEGSDANTSIGDVEVVVDADFLRHPVNKRVFESTPGLLKRGDMIPCDKDGNNV